MYCHQCGKIVTSKRVFCDECQKNRLIEERSSYEYIDDTYIEEIAPDEKIDFKDRGPKHPVKSKGVIAMSLGIFSLIGLIFQVFIPGGLLTLLAAAILSFIFSKQASHTKGAKYASIGIALSITSIILVIAQVMLTILMFIFRFIITSLILISLIILTTLIVMILMTITIVAITGGISII